MSRLSHDEFELKLEKTVSYMEKDLTRLWMETGELPPVRVNRLLQKHYTAAPRGTLLSHQSNLTGSNVIERITHEFFARPYDSSIFRQDELA